VRHDAVVTQTIAISVSAAATSAGVLIALFLPGLRERRRRPVLDLCDFDAESGDGTVVDAVGDDSSAWARLRVVNAPNRDAARSVEVVLERIEARTLDEERRRYFGLQSDLTVLWGNPMKWADRTTTIVIDIPAGSARRFDLVHVRNSMPHQRLSDGSLAVPLRLSFGAEPSQNQHLLGDLEYRLVVSVSAENAEPISRELVVRFGGRWRAGRAMWTDPDGISVTSSQAVQL
jgi:hypothetical protein